MVDGVHWQSAQYLLMTVKFTLELRVGLFWKSTRQRYSPVSSSVVDLMVSVPARPSTWKDKRSRYVSSDQCVPCAKFESRVSTLKRKLAKCHENEKKKNERD